MAGLDVKQSDGRVVFRVKVVPGSSRTAVRGLLDGMLKVKVAAAAEKGKANDCLIVFVAKELGVKKKAIEIVKGNTNPVKQLAVDGVSVEYVIGKFGVDRR
ncbi:MAG: DUF167 domain-containing protein [Planctomycetes bacterium]|nr:DUF167 domain-containing protein [Planctomycetota bacterium]